MNKELAICIPLSDLKPSAPQIMEDLFQSIVKGGLDEFSEIICLWDSCQERLVDSFERKYPQFISMPQYKNRLNYSKNSNRGMRFAHKELKLPVMVVNQDCELPPWDILKGILGAPKGICTPTAVPEFPEKIEPLTFTETRGKFSFHCPYFSPEVLEECGFIDEGLVTFTDDMAIVKSLLAGFTNTISNIPVIHKGSFIDQAAEGSSLSGAYNMERLGIDHQRFRWYWSIPPDVPHEDFSDWITTNYKWDRELMYTP
jgi:hypothetical protein